jgi:adenylate cyclase
MPGELTDNGLLKTEIREELESVLSGKVFSKSPLLSRFLRFVVERTLDGHANQIKEYTVGISVLDKPHSFNPQTDASVRINAIRLRKLLDEHYLENGNADGLRIQLPKGSYCPVFMTGTMVADITQPSKIPAKQKIPDDSICVVPFTALIHDKEVDFSIEGFGAYLSEKLSLFQDIKVLSYRSVSTYLNEGGDLEKLGDSLKVTYYLSGNIEIKDGHTQVSVHLFEAASNTLIWSQAFSGAGEKNSISLIIEQIVSKIVASLAGYSGLIHYKKFSSGEGRMPGLSDSQANAVFWFYHFQTRLSESVFHEALKKLEMATQAHPDCDLCWAVLAHLYAHSIVYHYKTDVENPLARAQAYLARAFSINPYSQQGYITLAWVNIFLRNKTEAKQALEKADEMNPNSSYAKAVCSLGMSFLGEYDVSEQLMEKAIPLHPLPYWWFNLPPIFTALNANDYSKMLFHARKIGTPAGIHEHVFEMIALYYLGETGRLKKLLKTYLEKFPEGIAHAMRAWPKILFDESLVEKLTYALKQMEEMNKTPVTT